MAKETQNSIMNPILRSNDLNIGKNIFRASESKFLINMKRQFKELKKEMNLKREELENLKKTLKSTKLNELQIENKILLEESAKYKNYYEITVKQNFANEKLLKENLELKEICKSKESQINSLEEKIKLMKQEIFESNEEILKLKKLNQTWNEKIQKLKKDLKFQYQINEKLIMNSGNIKDSNEYLQLKQEMNKKLKDMKKEIFYLKEQNAKKEKLIEDMKKFSQNSQNYTHKNFTIGNNFQNSDENPEEKTNATTLLINSKLREVMKENEKLKNENFQISEKIKILENKEFGVENLLKIDKSSNKMSLYNITTDVLSNVEKLNENQIDEMIYILIKNFEANRIDANIIETRIFENESLLNLLKEGQQKLFCEKLTNTILNLLKIINEKDKIAIYSLIKSYVFTNYSSDKMTAENFTKDFVGLFSGIEFYTSEQKGILSRKIKKKFFQIHNSIREACKFYDDSNRGYITFSNLKKILDHFELKPNPTFEFLVYLMKCFNDDSASIYDLKYENLFKIFEDNKNNSDSQNKNEIEDNEEFEEEEENEDNQTNEFAKGKNLEFLENEDEEVEIEITSKEYKRKISNFIVKLVKALTRCEISLEEQLTKIVSLEVSDYRAVRLTKLVEMLNEEYKIILDTIDIYCLFAKFRHDEFDQNEFEEELIDCDKLIQEVESLKNEEKDIKLKERVEKKLLNEKDKEKERNFLNSPKLEKSQKFNRNQDYHTDLGSSRQIANADFIQLIRNQLNSMKISFEDFIKSESLKIEKIVFNQNNSDFNRYMDINEFEKFLMIKEIIVLLHDPLKNNILKINRETYNIKIEDEVLFSDNKINIDYLKFIIEGTSDEKKQILNCNYKGYASVKIQINNFNSNDDKVASEMTEHQYDFNFSKKKLVLNN